MVEGVGEKVEGVIGCLWYSRYMDKVVKTGADVGAGWVDTKTGVLPAKQQVGGLALCFGLANGLWCNPW